MPVQKMLNVLKILFAALSAMFLLLYLSLTQRQANIAVEAAARNVRDTESLFNSVPLSPAMALIPMIVCIVFTVFLFIIGSKEKKKERILNEQTVSEKTEENTAESILDTLNNINDGVAESLGKNAEETPSETPEENPKD